MYRNIFTNDINLGFGSPRADTCSRCETLKAPELDEHKCSAATAFEEQAHDHKTALAESDVVYITFDLEKTLPLPRLSCAHAFYLCQLWIYNAGIHVVSMQQHGAFFQIWTLNEARR